jgi:hypothetical protein
VITGNIIYPSIYRGLILMMTLNFLPSVKVEMPDKLYPPIKDVPTTCNEDGMAMDVIAPVGDTHCKVPTFAGVIELKGPGESVSLAFP